MNIFLELGFNIISILQNKSLLLIGFVICLLRDFLCQNVQLIISALNNNTQWSQVYEKMISIFFNGFNKIESYNATCDSCNHINEIVS